MKSGSLKNQIIETDQIKNYKYRTGVGV